MPQTPQVNPYFEQASEFTINAASLIVPTSIVTGTPTVVDANSLGILIAGAGVGQVKRFVAAAAIKNAANPLLKTGEAVAGVDPSVNADIIKSQLVPLKVPDYLTNVNGASYKTEFLGTNVFDALTFGPDSYMDSKFTDFGSYDEAQTPTELASLRLNSSILSVSIDRTIVQTVPIGSNIGTIKELISLGEYTIKATGHIVNEQNPFDYPTAAIKLLNQYVNAPIAIKVQSNFLTQIFGIKKVVIESFNLTQVEGFSGMVTYDITMVSDTDIGLSTTNIPSGIQEIQNPNVDPGFLTEDQIKQSIGL